MTEGKTRLKILLVLATGFFMLTVIAQAQAAETMTPSQSYGYKTYFKYHPPKEKVVKNNLYPHPGPIIQYGQDIPVCAAARTAAPYAKKTEIRYLSHGKDGWLFRTIDYRTDFTASLKTIAYFTRLNKLMAARGQTLVVAFQPSRAMIAHRYLDPKDMPKGYSPQKARLGYQSFIRQLQEAGIMTADLSQVSDSVAYFPKADFHWTAEGADDAARKMAEVLKWIPAYDKIEKQDFTSKIVGMGPADRGAFEEFIQKNCHVNIELTTEPLWATMAENTKPANANSLFDDAVFPQITLLGTSNSAQDDKFNFVGALKRYARADIHNAALTGGGFGSSSVRYYASDEYHAHPPKIVVWEFLPQHNYNNAESLNSFRQMIPAVNGACSEKQALATYSGDIQRGQTNIFSNLKKQSIKDAYLYMEVTNPQERSLKVEVLYKNGDADQVDLTRSTRAPNNGKYYLELGDEKHDNALLMQVITDTPKGHISARLCQYPVQVAEK